LADSVARLVSAAIVEATLAAEPAFELGAPLVVAAVLTGTEAWLLPTLPIDIMAPISAAGIRGIGRDLHNLSRPAA
jgi:hypothetical protein